MESIPKTQYGFVFNKESLALTLREDIPVKLPSETGVLIKVEAAGLCHSDLHVFEGMELVGNQVIMGHEIFGKIVMVGSEAKNFKVGDRVAPHGANGCGECSYCREGNDNDCPEMKWMGLYTDGGYQQYLLVENTRNLVKVPDLVSDAATAAAITDAMLTPYRAIKRAKLSPTTRALFIGAGGLGSTAVEIAKVFGSHITVVDKKPEALKVAKERGADEAYTELPLHIKPASFDVCMDFVAIQPTFNLCQKYVKTHGIIVPVGLGSDHLTFNHGDLALREIQIFGTFWGSSTDLAECFEIAGKGFVRPKTNTFPLKELPQCIEKLKKGEVTGRIILIP